VRNSYGEDWGENGYFRINVNHKENETTCLIDLVALKPILKRYTIVSPSKIKT
jgi:hypothetical protein